MRFEEFHLAGRPILALPIPTPFFELDKAVETVLFEDANIFPISISNTGIDFIKARNDIAKYLSKIVELSEEVLSDYQALAFLSLYAEKSVEDSTRETLVVRFSVFNMQYSQILDMWDVIGNKIQKAVPTEALKELVVSFEHARSASAQQPL